MGRDAIATAKMAGGFDRRGKGLGRLSVEGGGPGRNPNTRMRPGRPPYIDDHASDRESGKDSGLGG